MESVRLKRILNGLKKDFFEVGAEWAESKDPNLLDELHALVGAINEIEIFVYDRRITTLLDCV